MRRVFRSPALSPLAGLGDRRPSHLALAPLLASLTRQRSPTSPAYTYQRSYQLNELPSAGWASPSEPAAVILLRSSRQQPV